MPDKRLPGHALAPTEGQVLVLDTNVVLDLFVFQEPAFAALHAVLQAQDCQWIGTVAMRDELVRVLGYPKIVAWMLRTGMTPEAVLTQVDALFQTVPEPDLESTQATSTFSSPVLAPARCQDPDDQKFIDLAWTRPCLLLSKDHAVLRLKRALFARGVTVSAIFPPSP